MVYEIQAESPLPSVERKLRQILDAIADGQGINIEEFNTDKDHIHMLIAATPYTDIPEMIKTMKGRTAYILFREFPWIRRYLWHGHLWSPSYFIATVSENTEEQVRHYIQTQKE